MAEKVTVPDPGDMDDDTFLRHMDKRHKKHIQVETALHKHAHIQQAWVGTYRAYHQYLHKTNEYKHEHLWDSDDDDD